MKDSKPLSQQKVYNSPELREYGDLREITRTVGKTSTTLDGGVGNMSKTQ